MCAYLPKSPRRSTGNFQKILDGFLKQPGLPFSDVLDEQTIESVFDKHGSLFAMDAIFCTATTLWAFLGQVLQDGKQAACQAAVAAVIGHRQLLGLEIPTDDTGDYCRARAKLSEDALHELACSVAEKTNGNCDPSWLVNGRHAKLVDGFTFTMPDTPLNQKQWPQQTNQAAGVGFPIARCVAVISLATACLCDLAIGPYAGKQTGETALLRQLMEVFLPKDIAVLDRYHCSFMMLAAMMAQGTDVCCRKHQMRKSDFRTGKRLGKYDHLIVWHRPKRPDWMDEQTYEKIPLTITLREIKYSITELGFRTKSITVITTLLDEEEFSKADIATIYGYRWSVELDIRSIKCNLNLGHVRCKSPAMVMRELWTTMLGYNLIRSTAAGAAKRHGLQPRDISFTATVQFVLAEWSTLAKGWLSDEGLSNYAAVLFEQIAACRVAQRPGRIEPRLVKKRPNQYKHMKMSRKNYIHRIKNQ